MKEMILKLKEKKMVTIIISVIIFIVIILIIIITNSRKPISTATESQLSEFENTYIGNNTDVNNIVDLLPYADKKEEIELLTSQHPYTLTIKYNMSSSKELLEYNTYKLFNLISNADKIVYKLYNGDISINRNEINEENLNIYSIINDYLISLEKPHEGENNQFKTFSSIKYFGLDNDKDNIIVYLWAVVESYYKEGEYVISSSGSSMPYKFILKDNKVLKYIIPEDGDKYIQSVEENFPQSIINHFDDIYVNADKNLHLNPNPNTIYSVGQENILDVNVKNDVTSFYGINEAEINYFNPYSLLTEEIGDSNKLTKIIEKYKISQEQDYDIYLYGITANVSINSEYISLERALEEKMLSIDRLIQYSKSNSVSTQTYKDGGSIIINCKEYTLIKMNKIGGDKSLYICRVNTNFDDISNLNTENNQVQEFLNETNNNINQNYIYNNVDLNTNEM